MRMQAAIAYQQQRELGSFGKPQTAIAVLHRSNIRSNWTVYSRGEDGCCAGHCLVASNYHLIMLTLQTTL
jgi:hypothetical protein